MSDDPRNKPFKRKRPRAEWDRRYPEYCETESETLFDDSTIAALTKMCGLTDENNETALAVLLREEASALQWTLYWSGNEVAAASQRAALTELSKTANLFFRQLSKLDTDSRGALSAELSALPSVEGDSTLSRTLAHQDGYESLRGFTTELAELCRSIEAAVARIPKGDGGRPIAVPGLVTCCTALAEVYERFADKNFTLTYDSKLDGMDRFLSEGSRFVAHAILRVVPAATPANIETAMRVSLPEVADRRNRRKSDGGLSD